MKTNDQLEPTVFVILGGAGDLPWRKLVPAPLIAERKRQTVAGAIGAVVFGSDQGPVGQFNIPFGDGRNPSPSGEGSLCEMVG
jgi:hypothetical protein